MPEKTTTLLVSNAGEPFEKLELALDSQGISAYRARGNAETPATQGLASYATLGDFLSRGTSYETKPPLERVCCCRMRP